MDTTITKTEQYKCPSVYENGQVQNCTCGKCTVTEPFTTQIPCPGGCGGQATLDVRGHAYEGVWECDTCGSDTCSHTEYHAEDTESFYFDIYGFPRSRRNEINVCDACDLQVNVEEYDYVD